MSVDVSGRSEIYADGFDDDLDREPVGAQDADLYGRLVDMVLAVHASQTPDEAVAAVAHHARLVVQADACGLLLLERQGRFVPAGSAAELAGIEIELDDGPGLTSARGTGDLIIVGDTSNDRRWPRWSARCAGFGLRSVLTVRLETPDRVVGSLSAYAKAPGAFSELEARAFATLAHHATVGLAAKFETASLASALTSRTMIGQAQGLLMSAHGIDSETAFAYLRRISQADNVKLVTVAEQVVAQRGRPAVFSTGRPDA